MLGPAGERPPFTWIPVKEDALSPSQPTLATQVLFSFPPLLQLLPSYDTVEEQTRSATDSALLLTRQLSEQHLPSPPLPQYKATTIVQRHTDRATCTTGV